MVGFVVGGDSVIGVFAWGLGPWLMVCFFLSLLLPFSSVFLLASVMAKSRSQPGAGKGEGDVLAAVTRHRCEQEVSNRCEQMAGTLDARSLIVLIVLIQKAKAPKEFIVVCYVTQPVLFILRERLMVRGRCGPLAGRLLGKGCGGWALRVAQGWLLKVPFWQLLGLFNLAQLASRNIPQGAPGKG